MVTVVPDSRARSWAKEAVLCVLCFTEDPKKDTYSTQEIFRTEIAIGTDRPRAALHGRLAGLFFEIDFKLAMAIFDYATGHGKVIATTSTCHVSPQMSLWHSTDRTSIVRSDLRGASVHHAGRGCGHMYHFRRSPHEVDVFLNIGTMLAASQNTQYTLTILSPNATLKIPYNEHSQVQDADEWRILCPRNITNSYQVPVITLSEIEEGLDVMTFDWLDVEEIVQAVKSGAALSESRGRNIFNFAYPIAGTSRTSKVWGIGSKGCHEVWIDHSDPDRSRVLNVVPLHKEGNNLWRPLRLPINIDRITDILAFSDEAAVVAVLTEACETGDSLRHTAWGYRPQR